MPAPNGSLRARFMPRRELGAEVGEQLGLADRHRELPARTDQLGVRDRADVIEVERVLARRRRARRGRLPQPVAGARVAERARGERQLRAAELEVVAPRGLGVERVRERGGDVAHAARLGGAVDLRGGGELGARSVGLGRGVELRGEREGGRRRGRRGWAGSARRARWRGRRGGCGGSGCGAPLRPSSFCGSRHTSWSPLNVPAVLPEPMPTWSSIVPSSCHALSSHARPKRASGSSCGGAAAPSSRRAISSSADA